jgi:ribosomal protein L11 methyltransferase
MRLKPHSPRQEKTNDYIEIRLVVPESTEEQVSNFLTDLGSKGVWIQPDGRESTVIGYLSGESDIPTVRASILGYLDELRELGYNPEPGKIGLRRIEYKDRGEEWKKSFKPILVTDDIVILPEWDKSGFPGKIVIRIKQGMAFGTGDHATTQLCIRALAKFVKPGDSLIDVGCGSGILSIVSVRLGAVRVLGLDIDQDAIINAEENLILNNVEDIVEVRQGMAHAGIPSDSFDVAVANINRIEIVESYDKIAPLVKNGGILIFSGILDGEEGYMTDFFRRQKLKDTEITRQEEWACFVGRK